MTRQLVFVTWFLQKAVYLNCKLIFFGEGDFNRVLLGVLGFECRSLGEIDTHKKSPELDWDAKTGWWKPPQSLEILKRQLAAVKERKRQEQITYHRDELKRLEVES